MTIVNLGISHRTALPEVLEKLLDRQDQAGAAPPGPRGSALMATKNGGIR
jgi:hypothetical protein